MRGAGLLELALDEPLALRGIGGGSHPACPPRAAPRLEPRPDRCRGTRRHPSRSPVSRSAGVIWLVRELAVARGGLLCDRIARRESRLCSGRLPYRFFRPHTPRHYVPPQ